jgi:hypothetical protein
MSDVIYRDRDEAAKHHGVYLSPDGRTMEDYRGSIFSDAGPALIVIVLLLLIMLIVI